MLRRLYFRKVFSQFSPPMAESRRLLAASQWWSPEQVRRLQDEKLRALVGHAAERVPFYRQRFAECGLDPRAFRGQEDLEKLPLLTRRDIQEHLDSLLTEGMDRTLLRRSHTGGSTGEPLTFFRDQAYLSRCHADLWRNLEWCGFRVGDRQCYLWGSDVDAKRYTGAWGRLRGWFQNILWIDVFDLKEDRLAALLPRISRFRPSVLVGYVSALVLFARVARVAGVAIPSLRGIQSSAEALTPSLRREIEEAFGTKVFDRYGCREVGNIAHECAAHSGLHVNAENNLVEVVRGQIVVTNLNNRAMPFIRYVVGDTGELGSPDRCACGRGLPRLKVIAGRSTDMIRTPSGRLLHGEFFTHLFYGVEGVRRFQVVQETLRDLTVRIVRGPGFDPGFPERLTQMLREHGDPGFQVRFEFPEEIDSSPSGKFQFVRGLGRSPEDSIPSSEG